MFLFIMLVKYAVVGILYPSLRCALRGRTLAVCLMSVCAWLATGSRETNKGEGKVRESVVYNESG